MSVACRNWLGCLLACVFVLGCEETSSLGASKSNVGENPRVHHSHDDDAGLSSDAGGDDPIDRDDAGPVIDEMVDAGTPAKDPEKQPDKGKGHGDKGAAGKPGKGEPTTMPEMPTEPPDAGAMQPSEPVMMLPPVGGTADAAGCSSTTAPSGDRCGSFFCGVTAAQLEAEATPDRRCRDVAFACTTRLDQAVSKCARDIALRTGSTNFQAIWPMIRQCALGTDDIGSHADESCADCLLDSLACTARACLLSCANDGPQCDDCARRNGCFDSLASCAGLPSPF